MRLVTLALPALAFATAVAAQQPAQAPASTVPEVGAMAPDFEFRPVTKDGIQGSAKKLSDYRGETVVIWFFVRARTRG